VPVVSAGMFGGHVVTSYLTLAGSSVNVRWHSRQLHAQ
jgi:hypothetical protein